MKNGIEREIVIEGMVIDPETAAKFFQNMWDALCLYEAASNYGTGYAHLSEAIDDIAGAHEQAHECIANVLSEMRQYIDAKKKGERP